MNNAVCVAPSLFNSRFFQKSFDLGSGNNGRRTPDKVAAIHGQQVGQP
jgi:hypothetical protein